MVISSYFLFLRVFHFPFSFNSIYFYLGWSLSARRSGVYHGIHGRIGNREVFCRSSKITVNTVTWTLCTTSICFGRKMFFQNRNVYPSNVWFITMIAFNSVGLLRNNYFKISSSALSNLVCNIWKFIFYSLRQFFDVYRMILH